MTVKDIYSHLDSCYPFALAADFDNVGILVGNPDNKVTKALVTLDCSLGAIFKAKEIGAELIITHHPVIFEPLKAVLNDSITYELLRSGISVISAHTNLDIANGGVNDTLCSVLNLQNVTTLAVDGFEIKLGEVTTELSPDEFASNVCKSLGCTAKYVCGKEQIKKVGVCSGSGAEFFRDAVLAGADAFVTADIKYHYFVDADNLGVTLVDAGHFDTENIIIPVLTQRLTEHFGDIFTPFQYKYIKTAYF